MHVRELDTKNPVRETPITPPAPQAGGVQRRSLLRQLARRGLAITRAERGLQWLQQAVNTVGRNTHYQWNPRVWSNRQLERFGALFVGEVVNVSGWRDGDKEARGYRQYFPRCTRYTVTNYPGKRGLDDAPVDSIPLDLEQPAPPALRHGFDVVFNHTTLEHVFDLHAAADTLAGLTRDALLLVVPFQQEFHPVEGHFGDFWRFSPMALERLFRARGLETVYASMNDQPWWPTYVFWFGSRHPERWRDRVPPSTTWDPYRWEDAEAAHA